MIIQEPPLAFAEWADIDNAISLYAHPVQGMMIGDWRDDEPTVVLEADKSSVEQVIDARRQQQSILAVQAFFVVRVSPRLAVARPQVGEIFNQRDPASVFQLHDPLFEKPLPLPGNDQLFTLGFRYSWVTLDLNLEMVLPEFHVGIYGLHGDFRVGTTRRGPDGFCLRANHPHQHFREVHWHGGQVNGLNAVTIRLQWRILSGQQVPENAHVIFGSYLVA